MNECDICGAPLVKETAILVVFSDGAHGWYCSRSHVRMAMLENEDLTD